MEAYLSPGNTIYLDEMTKISLCPEFIKRIDNLEAEIKALREWIDRVEDQLDGRED